MISLSIIIAERISGRACQTEGRVLFKLLEQRVFLIPLPYLEREQSPQISGRIWHPVYHVLSWSCIEFSYGDHQCWGTPVFALHCYQHWRQDFSCSSCCLSSAGYPGLRTAAGASRLIRRWCVGVCSAKQNHWLSGGARAEQHLFQINSEPAATREANNPMILKVL